MSVVAHIFEAGDGEAWPDHRRLQGVGLVAVDLHAEDWPAADAIAAYYGRNSFENRIGAAAELGLDRIASPARRIRPWSASPCGTSGSSAGSSWRDHPSTRLSSGSASPSWTIASQCLASRSVLVAQLAELDWETLLLGRPGGGSTYRRVLCDQDRALTLTTVRLREGSRRAGLFCRPSGGYGVRVAAGCLRSSAGGQEAAEKHLVRGRRRVRAATMPTSGRVRRPDHHEHRPGPSQDG
ncbi:MAG: hypothetical protein R3F59_26280 [Myxococcota bacterium]